MPATHMMMYYTENAIGRQNVATTTFRSFAHVSYRCEYAGQQRENTLCGTNFRKCASSTEGATVLSDNAQIKEHSALRRSFNGSNKNEMKGSRRTPKGSYASAIIATCCLFLIYAGPKKFPNTRKGSAPDRAKIGSGFAARQLEAVEFQKDTPQSWNATRTPEEATRHNILTRYDLLTSFAVKALKPL